MKTLAIDIETYSSVSLQKCGVYAYAQSPDFEILLFGYAWDDGPVEVIDLAKGQSLPQELQDALYDPEILKTAFNASFERTCLSAFMGRVTPPEQWSCTAVMARELGLPGSLEAVGEVIGLPEDKHIFNRDILINESESIDNCAKSVGIISDETIVAMHPWVDDPAAELERLEKQKEEADPYRAAFEQANALRNPEGGEPVNEE